MDVPPHSDVSMLTSLRASRWFTTAPVSDEELRQVLEAGRWAGSARNRQPWRFVVVRSGAVRRRLSGLGAYAAHLATAPVVIALAVDEDAGGEDAQAAPYRSSPPPTPTWPAGSAGSHRPGECVPLYAWATQPLPRPASPPSPPAACPWPHS